MGDFVNDDPVKAVERKADYDLPGPVGPSRIAGRDINEINDKLLSLRSAVRSIGGSGLTTEINVKDHGATGDGVTDDWAAITAALAVGRVQRKPVVFPPGTYIVSRPVRIISSFESIKGLGQVADQTTINNNRPYPVGWYGPTLVVQKDLPPEWDLHYVAPLRGTVGRTFKLRADNTQPFINVKDVQAGSIQGRTALQFDFFVRRTGAQGGVVISSHCSLYKGDTARVPYRVRVNQYNNCIEASVRLGSTDYTLNSATNSVPNDGSIHHVRVAFDGTKFGIAVDGTWSAQTNATGGLDMRAYEDLTLFCEFSRPHSTNVVNYAPAADVQSLYMTPNIATPVGTNFTAPTAAANPDGQTIFCFNAAENDLDGPLICGRSLGNPSWYVIRSNQIPPFISKVSVENLKISSVGTALISYGAIQSTYRNLDIFGRCGVEIGNGTFLAKYEDIVINYNGRFGVRHDSGSGVNHMDRAEIFGGGDGSDPWSMSYFLVSSSARITNLYFSAVRWGLFALGSSGQCAVNMSFCVLTDEGAEGNFPIDAGLYLEDVLAFSSTGCTFEVKKVAAVIVKSAGDVRAAHNGDIYTTNPSATKVFQTIGPSPKVSHTLVECNRWSADGGANEAQVPWGDNYGLILAGVKQP